VKLFIYLFLSSPKAIPNGNLVSGQAIIGIAHVQFYIMHITLVGRSYFMNSGAFEWKLWNQANTLL